MERPAIQLYFGDFEGNEKVKRCSWAARGALLYVMGLLHRSDEYGALRWRLAEIAQAIGAPLPLVKEIAAKGCLKGSDARIEAYRWAPRHAGKRGTEVILVAEQDGPLWYSSRMVRDEYKRTTRGIGTRFGAPPKLPTGAPKAVPDGTPTHANGDAKREPNRAPSQREGYGASSSASALNPSGVVTPTVEDGRPDGDKSPTKQRLNGRRPTPPTGWHETNAGIEAAAILLNTPARPGEKHGELKARLFAKIYEAEEG